MNPKLPFNLIKARKPAYYWLKLRNLCPLSRLILLTILLASCHSNSNQNGNENVNQLPDTVIIKSDVVVEDKIIDTLFQLPEISARATLIEEQTHGNRHLKIWIADQPHPPDQPYYWVKAGEDNGVSFVSHFNFFVYPDPIRIMYFDTRNDRVMTLEAWRNEKKD